MKPAAQLQATIDLLDEINTNGYPADRTMAQYFKQRRYIGSKDKAAISENFYQVLRNKLSYEYLLTAADLGTHARLLVACMKQCEGADLTELFSGDKYAPAPLRPQQLSQLATISGDLSHAPQHIQLNVPEWIAPKLQAALGDSFDVEMRATNQRASTDVRVNTLKSTRAQLQQVLSNKGHSFAPTPLSEWGFRFTTRVALFALDAFKQGWFEIQDEGSQLLAQLTNVEAGQKVVDFCAGAGGKTMAMAAMMQNKGTIYACDVHSKRLEQLAKRCKRAGVHNVRSHVLSSENDKWVKKHRELADVVLLDAPCTGTGTWRRNPDARWNLSVENLADLCRLQRSILRSAQRLLKPGGVMYYATCSLLLEENEQQVEQFLIEHEDFELSELSLPAHWGEQELSMVVHQGHQLRTTPALSNTDGFFVAALRKKSSSEDKPLSENKK